MPILYTVDLMLQIEDIKELCKNDTIALTEHLLSSIGEGCLYIITAYRPSPEKWEADGSKRKGDKP